jgi:hypothetical protein
VSCSSFEIAMAEGFLLYAVREEEENKDLLRREPRE